MHQTRAGWCIEAATWNFGGARDPGRDGNGDPPVALAAGGRPGIKSCCLRPHAGFLSLLPCNSDVAPAGNIPAYHGPPRSAGDRSQRALCPSFSNNAFGQYAVGIPKTGTVRLILDGDTYRETILVGPRWFWQSHLDNTP